MLLRTYQKEAVQKIVSAYNENINKLATVCIPTGYGVSAILIESVNQILNNNQGTKVLYLTRYREESLQFSALVNRSDCNFSVCISINEYTNQSVLAVTYNTYFAKISEIREMGFGLIICRGAESLTELRHSLLLREKSRLVLGVYAVKLSNETTIFRNAPCLYEIRNTDYRESVFIEDFAVPMLSYLGYTDININKGFYEDELNFRPDIVAMKDGVTNFIEIKTYRGMFNDRQVLRYATGSIIRYKSALEHKYPNSLFGLILTCVVDESVKREIAKEHGVFVWDIKNLLYLCSENIKLSDILEQITSYSLNAIKPEKPIEFNSAVKSATPIEAEDKYETELIKKLKNCKTGKTKKADKEYEKICSEIISYLFKNEFSQFSEQHATNDAMFRMDIICGLKGTVAFWKFLIKYYNTRFVVFECKNYSHKIEQNLIYVTDKYLFNPALRNVAFIISRKGFNENAQKAALGILKEQGKLILDLTDSDLEIMINAKTEGKEPSDFLLDKVEKLLMGVSI